MTVGHGVNLRIDFEEQSDGVWLAEVATLPGSSASGPTREVAKARCVAKARQILADREDGVRHSNGEVQ